MIEVIKSSWAVIIRVIAVGLIICSAFEAFRGNYAQATYGLLLSSLMMSRD